MSGSRSERSVCFIAHVTLIRNATPLPCMPCMSRGRSKCSQPVERIHQLTQADHALQRVLLKKSLHLSRCIGHVVEATTIPSLRRALATRITKPYDDWNASGYLAYVGEVEF